MTDLERLILSLANPKTTVSEIASRVGCSRTTAYRVVQQFGVQVKQRKSPGKRSALVPKILSLADGLRTSKEIAAACECSAKHVQTILRIHGASALPRGARKGELNPSYKTGRRIDLDGYVIVSVEPSHPFARCIPARHQKIMLEHRLVLERELGRYLLPSEVVDHIDGLHLHNHPSNLRVFEANADHLRETLKGIRPAWSAAGFEKMQIIPHLRPNHPRVDSYGQRRKRGDVRLQQILLAALQLGIGSPFLLGTHRHLEQAQIDYSSPTKIKQALDLLSQKSE